MPYKNPEDRRRNARKYRAENHEKVRVNERKAEKAYAERHPERIRLSEQKQNQSPKRKEYRRNWSRENPEKQHEYDQRYYLKHREAEIAKRIQWRKDNPEKEQAYKMSERGRSVRNAAGRRRAAKKNGYAECTEYPPPPSDSKCSICHRQEKLSLDHDHETGHFRGYICRKCNLGLGMLGDTTEAIRRVLHYLEHIAHERQPS